MRGEVREIRVKLDGVVSDESCGDCCYLSEKSTGKVVWRGGKYIELYIMRCAIYKKNIKKGYLRLQECLDSEIRLGEKERDDDRDLTRDRWPWKSAT